MVTNVLKEAGDIEGLNNVPGYEGLYVFNLSGEVFSCTRVVKSPQAGGRRTVYGQKMKMVPSNGYPAYRLSKHGKMRSILLHRMIASVFIPNPEAKPFVNHIDGDKANFSIENLEWCTHQENMGHAFRTGLAPYPKTGPGEASPSAKLTWDIVREIRRLVGEGVPKAKIAAMFSVSIGNIYQISGGQTWKEG